MRCRGCLRYGVVLVVVALAAAADEAPFFGPTVDISDMEDECDRVGNWFTYEASIGDSVTLKENDAKVTLEQVENKVRGWRPKGEEGFNATSDTLLCVSYTFEKKHPQAANIHNTWGKLCDRHIIVTNKASVEGVPDADVLFLVPEGGESNHNLWMKTTAIIQALVSREELSRYDFYFIGGDDVMMIPSNLRRVISEPGNTFLHRSGAPLFFGTRFVSPPGDSLRSARVTWGDINDLRSWPAQTEFLSGSGYVLNNVALRVVYFGVVNKERDCNPGLQSHAEDVYIALCLQHYGIMPRDSRDAQGEDRVQVMTPYHMASQSANPAYTWWFRDFKPVPTPMGSEITSRHSFVWHYMGTADVARMTKKYEK